jgi:hypothetical protein
MNIIYMPYSICEPPRPPVEQRIIKRGEPSDVYGNIFLLARRDGEKLTQKIYAKKSIKFNRAENLRGIIWNGSDALKIIKDGIYKINFQVNYKLHDHPVQIGVLVNDHVPKGYHGEHIPLDDGVGQLSGEYLLALKKYDIIKLINAVESDPIKITNAGHRTERIANLSLLKVN